MDRWGAPGAGQPGLQCGSGRAGATLNASEGRSLLRVLDFELFTRVVSRRWHAHCNGVATRHRKACLRPVRVVQGLAVWTDGRAVGVDAAIIETRQRALPVSRTWPSSIEPNRSLPPASAWPSLRRLPGRSSSPCAGRELAARLVEAVQAVLQRTDQVAAQLAVPTEMLTVLVNRNKFPQYSHICFTIDTYPSVRLGYFPIKKECDELRSAVMRTGYC